VRSGKGLPEIKAVLILDQLPGGFFIKMHALKQESGIFFLPFAGTGIA